MKNLLHIALLAPLLAGCVSVGTTFTSMKPNYDALPEEATRQLARDIEEAVSRGEREAVIEVPEGLSIDSEDIRQAIRTRAARSELVDAFTSSVRRNTRRAERGARGTATPCWSWGRTPVAGRCTREF